MSRIILPRKGKVICWDLEGTIGVFDPEELEGLRKSVRIKKGINFIVFRPEIREVLNYLSSQGFYHFITTSAQEELARQWIQKAGISNHFEEVYGRETVSTQPFRNKIYSPVIEDIGFSEKQANKRMIVIGDGGFDAPEDLEGVVYLMISYRIFESSRLILPVLEVLLEKGRGDFNKGYKKLSKLERYRLEDGSQIRFQFAKKSKKTGKKGIYNPRISFYKTSKNYSLRPEIIQ